MSNLKHIGLCIALYSMDNDYKRMVVRVSDSYDGNVYWMGKIAPYADEDYGKRFRLGEKIDLLLCPSAPYSKFEKIPYLDVSVGQMGTAKMPWEWKKQGDFSTIGSYGMNGFIVYDAYYESFFSDMVYKNWDSAPANVPFVACSRWTMSWPLASDTAPLDLGTTERSI